MRTKNNFSSRYGVGLKRVNLKLYPSSLSFNFGGRQNEVGGLVINCFNFHGGGAFY